MNERETEGTTRQSWYARVWTFMDDCAKAMETTPYDVYQMELEGLRREIAEIKASIKLMAVSGDPKDTQQ